MNETLTKREKKQKMKAQMIMLKEMMEDYKGIAADIKDIELFKRIKKIEAEMEGIVKHFDDQMIF